MILVCGDLHGVWQYTNQLISRKHPDIILQTGDFGWWPKLHKSPYITGNKNKRWDQYGLKNHDCKIYFCDGNHEDHWDLQERDQTCIHEVMDNVFYVPRFNTIKLPDDRTVLFVGGARSTDSHLRQIGVDWFPEEEIKYRDLDRLPKGDIDIVISHTAPREFTLPKKYTGSEMHYHDSSRDALSLVLETYKPKLWFFGHWHDYLHGTYNETEWHALHMTGEVMWWKKI